MSKIDPNIEIVIDWDKSLDELAAELSHTRATKSIERLTTGKAYDVSLREVVPAASGTLYQLSGGYWVRKGFYPEGSFRYHLVFDEVPEGESTDSSELANVAKQLASDLRVDVIAGLMPDADNDDATPSDVRVVFDSRTT